MKKRILITLPKSDDATEYLSCFSKEIIDSCFEHSIEVIKLDKDSANKENFEKLLKKLDFNMIILNGHGSPDCITGHKNEDIIKIGENENLLLGKITYARSCWFALGLEKCEKHVNDKDGCFIGYKIPFEFLIDLDWTAIPRRDSIAKIFFDTSNLAPIGLIKGHSAKEAHENSKRSMLKAMNRALSNQDADSLAIAKSLWNNYSGQTLIGNQEITV